MSIQQIAQAKRQAIAGTHAAFDVLLSEIASKYPKRDPYSVAARLERCGADGTPFKMAFSHLQRRMRVEEAVVNRWLAVGGMSVH